MSAAIKFEGVSKRYRLGEVGTGTLSHDLQRAWAKLRGKPDPFAKVGHVNDRTARSTDQPDAASYVWALRDIDFEVPQGEILGIVGRNGAGKSTLLKLLSRVTAPTDGLIKTNGRIASLLEVGTGFHPELTGRENIYLNGVILGMRRHEITKQLEEIVEFSGCAKYIDTPVKRYSSGMTVRLGFSVAAHLDCEILVVDEVLAVGDAEFQKKCVGRMKEVSQGSGKTVLFVSHNMGSIQALCKQGVLLDQGELVSVGPVADTIHNYFDRNSEPDTGLSWRSDSVSEAAFSVEAVEVIGKDSKTKVIDPEDSFSIRIEYVVRKELPPMRMGFLIYSYDGTAVVEAYDSDRPESRGNRPPGRYRANCTIPGRLLNPGLYFLTVNAGIPNVENLWNRQGIVKFTIHESQLEDAQRAKRHGVLQPRFEWETASS